MAREFTITVAPNGARRTKADHPALPLTTQEISETARFCFDAGADAIHLHVRDNAGRHSLDTGRYSEAIAAIRETTPEMIIQITTEAAGIYDVPDQYSCLQQLCPNAASVSVREMNRDAETATRLYAFADEAEIDVQHICYDLNDIATLVRWRRKGIIAGAMNSVLYVIGTYAPPVPGRPADLDPLLTATKAMDFDWSLCAFGGDEAACLRYGLEKGGNIRTGFENNLHLPDGRLAPDNSALVRIMRKAGLSLGLTPRNNPEPVS